jgi:hypothetical protein
MVASRTESARTRNATGMVASDTDVASESRGPVRVTVAPGAPESGDIPKRLSGVWSKTAKPAGAIPVIMSRRLPSKSAIATPRAPEGTETFD